MGFCRLATPVTSRGHDTMKTVNISISTPCSMPGQSSTVTKPQQILFKQQNNPTVPKQEHQYKLEYFV